MSSFGKDRDASLAGHPTPKPLALVSDAILDCSKRGGIVLDPFAGSGTTLLAAEKTGRRGYGIEFDPHYADLIIKRFEEVYGLEAIHVDSDFSFDRLRTQRTERIKDGKKTDTNNSRTVIKNDRKQSTGKDNAGSPQRREEATPTKKQVHRGTSEQPPTAKERRPRLNKQNEKIGTVDRARSRKQKNGSRIR